MPTLVEYAVDSTVHDVLPDDDNELTSAQVAGEWTAKYRELNNPDDDDLIRKGGFFGKAAVQALLNQNNCIGLRYYFASIAALDGDGQPILNESDEQVYVTTLVLCGLKAGPNEGELVDMVMSNSKILEMSSPCPPMCSNPNALNS